MCERCILCDYQGNYSSLKLIASLNVDKLLNNWEKYIFLRIPRRRLQSFIGVWGKLKLNARPPLAPPPVCINYANNVLGGVRGCIFHANYGHWYMAMGLANGI